MFFHKVSNEGQIVWDFVFRHQWKTINLTRLLCVHINKIFLGLIQKFWFCLNSKNFRFWWLQFFFDHLWFAFFDFFCFEYILYFKLICQWWSILDKLLIRSWVGLLLRNFGSYFFDYFWNWWKSHLWFTDLFLYFTWL